MRFFVGPEIDGFDEGTSIPPPSKRPKIQYQIPNSTILCLAQNTVKQESFLDDQLQKIDLKENDLPVLLNSGFKMFLTFMIEMSSAMGSFSLSPKRSLSLWMINSASIGPYEN